MSRFLRNKDRDLNAENYPHLKYPEVYLLKDGYKAFYQNDTVGFFKSYFQSIIYSNDVIFNCKDIFKCNFI